MSTPPSLPAYQHDARINLARIPPTSASLRRPPTLTRGFRCNAITPTPLPDAALKTDFPRQEELPSSNQVIPGSIPVGRLCYGSRCELPIGLGSDGSAIDPFCVHPR
jgi:hypothetical protein